MTIGESFKRFRKEFNLTQSNVAEKLGILQQSYYKYETDKVKPSAEIIIDLANAYDVSTDYLLGRSDNPRPAQFDEKEVREAFAFRDMIGAAVAKQLAGQVPAQ